MSTPVLFEHPLNEKMRTWLRIEFLLQQLTVHARPKSVTLFLRSSRRYLTDRCCLGYVSLPLPIRLNR